MENFFTYTINILEKYYPKDQEYHPIVPESVILETISDLNKIVKFEQFYFVMDLVKREVTSANGFEMWLGLPDNLLNFPKFLQLIHPRHHHSVNLFIQAIFQYALDPKNKLAFMQQKVVNNIPIRHADGKYFLTKRTMFPFQIDKSGKILSALLHFVVLKPYQELDTLEIQDYKLENEKFKSVNNEVLMDEKFTFIKKNIKLGFNPKEWTILRFLAQNPKKSQAEMCEELNISLDTLRKTYNTRILNKAKAFFGTDKFENLKTLSTYLNNEGFI